jgi:hypothetical protein
VDAIQELPVANTQHPTPYTLTPYTLTLLRLVIVWKPDALQKYFRSPPPTPILCAPTDRNSRFCVLLTFDKARNFTRFPVILLAVIHPVNSTMIILAKFAVLV